MELIHTHQIPFDKLRQESIDVFISTCTSANLNDVIHSMCLIPAKKKFLFFLGQNKTNCNDLNDIEIININPPEIDNIIKSLTNLCQHNKNHIIKLVIDYSDMPKSILGAIISFLSLSEIECSELEVYFICQPIAQRKNSELNQSKSNGIIKPILLYENYKFNNRPISILLNLKTESQLSNLDIVLQTFEPIKLYVFYPDNIRLKEIIHFESDVKYITFSQNNIELLENDLRSLVRQLRMTYRVIIIPGESKVFSMLSFLINARYPDVEIWQWEDDKYFVEDNDCYLEPLIYKAQLTGED